ncbi:MAG TPA: NUDIX hydrolase [Candidatus Saccharimonadales bacterium]|nr:NUDIX hydrolase [Candidatus Saccharimonadales bacterium]
MSDWKTISSKIVYETPWIKIHRDEVLNQNGNPLTYSYMELQNPSVYIVAVNTDGNILLHESYRYTLRRRMWEVPAGFIDAGEEPLAAAQRELMEEGGLVSTDWQSLGCAYQITGTGNVPMHVFLAQNVTKKGKALDEEEDIQNDQFVSFDTIEVMIASGDLIDSSVMGALYMAKIFLEEAAKGGQVSQPGRKTINKP